MVPGGALRSLLRSLLAARRSASHFPIHPLVSSRPVLGFRSAAVPLQGDRIPQWGASSGRLQLRSLTDNRPTIAGPRPHLAEKGPASDRLVPMPGFNAYLVNPCQEVDPTKEVFMEGTEE